MRSILLFVVVAGMLFVSGCVSDKAFSNAQVACADSGGKWEYSECDGHCIPETQAERLACDEKGCMCTTVCTPGYKCTCPAGMKWGSKEEGCIRI